MSFFAPPPRIAERSVDANAARAAASSADAAIVTIGRIAGEGGDRKVADDFELAASERSLLDVVSREFRARGKPVIVVLNVGGPVEMASWRGMADAILLAWQPGQEGGNAIADVIGGRVNPSGRLATTFPVRYADVPFAADFPGRVVPGDSTPTNMFMGPASENAYREGVFVGYRYQRSFGVTAAYPFGYGLSYTTFRIGAPQLKGSIASLRDTITVSATVTNTGAVAGREVAQLYVARREGGWRSRNASCAAS